jgi:hypothetical protein
MAMTRVSGVRVWMTMVASVACASLELACQKPTVCPQGFDERPDGDQAVWCRARGGAQSFYYFLHPGSRRKRQSCPFAGNTLEGTFEAWHADGRPWLRGQYLGGQLAGTWQQWSETGSKVADGEYRDGRLIRGAPVAMASTCETVKPDRK